MINRGAILLKYKEPAVQWINEADPTDKDPGISMESVNEERNVYLVTNEDADGPEAVSNWVRANFEVLFENELEGWYTLESLWPENRTFTLFNEWFDVECHSIIEDTVDMPIYNDET